VRNIVPDLREALRQWRRTPVITVAALLSLTLGIGASTAMFSLLNALLLKTLPVRDPQQIVTLRDSRSPTPLNLRVSYPMFEVLSRDGAGLDGVAVYGEQPLNIAAAGEPARHVRGMFVSGSYFNLLGVPAALGRLLTPADDDLAAPARVAVVSESFWRGTFGADPAVIGRTIDILQESFTIVGVTDRRFLGLTVGQAFDIALPVTSHELLYRDGRLRRGQFFWLTAIGRVPAGQPIAAAEARLPAAQARAIREGRMPEVISSTLLQSQWRLLPTATAATGSRATYQRPLLILLGITLIVLAVACMNIANLLIARMTARRSELAVRLSLGATRARLVRQLALEAVVMAAAGTVTGIAAGVGGSRLLIWLLSTSRNPVQLDLTFDWRLAAFAAAAGTTTALVAGVLPAWRSMGVDPIDAIKARAAGAIGGTRRMGATHILIGSQIALTFVLVLGGLVFSGSFARLVAQDRGFDRGRVHIVHVTAPRGSPTAMQQLALTLQEGVRVVPGVADAALSWAAPFGTVTFINFVSTTGPQPERKRWPEELHTFENMITANYFDVMGMRVLSGRGFTGPGDRSDAVVVNTAFAKKFFDGASPLGRTVWLDLEQTPHEVIGVVNDTRSQSLRAGAPSMMYRTWPKEPRRSNVMQLTVRSAGPLLPPALLARAIREQFAAASVEVRSLDVEVDDTIATERATATLAFAFGILGLLLAAVGLYGVLSREVQMRTPEIAVRMALGAEPRRVRRLVLLRIFVALAAGVAAGIALSVSAEQLVRSLLHEVQPSDGTQLALCTAILLGVAIAAAAPPVRRATRVDPMTVLRSE
jgi:putative ABC transport system permease protein